MTSTTVGTGPTAPAADASGVQPLPAWPVVAPLVTYPVWWFLGVGELALAVFALPAGVILVMRGGARMPRGFGIWLLFVLLIVLSLSQVDEPSRLVGAGYRLVLYGSLTTLFVYAYNARAGLSVRRLCSSLVVFLGIITFSAIAALLFPLWQWTTPLAWVLPDSLLSNELVGEMAWRRLTQFDPTAYNADLVSPRPSAPFLYTNAWGTAYSMLVPFTVLYMMIVKRGWRFWLTGALLMVSIVPAALTLNRGMLLGLLCGAAYCTLRALVAGQLRVVAGITVALMLGGLVITTLPVADRIETRNENVSSGEVRASLYEETFEHSLRAPLLGYGAPRPSEIAGAPSMGTQGQFWANLFSHGFLAAGLAVLWMLHLSWQAWRRFDPLHVACGAVVAMAILEHVYYGFLPFGYLLMMLAGSLLCRSAVTDRAEE